MKKIGYIHEFNNATGKGVLVHHKGCIGESSELTVFSKGQCLSLIRGNTLVFFTQAEDGAIIDIEEASIFNFNRESLLYYASSYNLGDSRSTLGLSTYISYKNNEALRSLIKEVEDEKDASTHQRHRKRKSQHFEYAIEGILELSEIPGLEFGLEEGNLAAPMQIRIDILDPKFWIPESIIWPERNYYGSNCNEFIDLFDLLIIRRRKYNDVYLEHIRTTNHIYATLSSKGMLQALHPELFQDNRVSSLWGVLLNQLTEDEISEIYSSYPILQPVLSDSYCLSHLDLMSEIYGFPSVNIAERFLSHIVSNATTATKYSHAIDLLNEVQHCSVKHLDGEGIPLCAIDKARLEELANSLNQNLIDVENCISIQLNEINKFCFDAWMSLERPIKNDTIIKIGCLCDKIKSFSLLQELPDYSFCLEFMKEYNSLSQETKNIFTQYLRTSLQKSLLFSLSHLDLSPSELHMILDVFSSLELPWSSTIGVLASNKYSKLSKTTDLIDAYSYNYISIEVFTSEYIKLSRAHTSQQLINDLMEDYTHLLPDEIVIHILRRVGEDINNNGAFVLPDDTTIDSPKDFIEWVDKLCRYDYLCESDAQCVKLEFAETLSTDERWELFEDKLISSPGKECIIRKLKEVYEYYGSNCSFKDWYFKEDCFQEQMLLDIQEVSDIKLIYAIVNALNNKYRNVIISSNNFSHAIRLYVWSLTPNEYMDWKGLEEHMAELPIANQIRIFNYIFYLKAIGKINENVDILDKLKELLGKGIEAAPLTHSTPNGVQFNYMTILGVIVFFLEQKLQNSQEPIKYSQIEKIIGSTRSDSKFFIKGIVGFFEGGLKINSIEDWEVFRFVDFLRILKGSHIDLDSIYKVNVEIIRFLEEVADCTQEDLAQLESHPLSESDIIDFTTDDEDESNFDEDDEDYYDEDYQESYQDKKTYERYGGTWAQDVEGYSDDDIDDIFDGDPSAYWNID